MRTFRREILDEFLKESSCLLHGKILDVGGKKDKKRGEYLSDNKNASWKYLNIDKETNPDYLCSAENIPLPECTFDVVLMCEVVEHLENPEDVISEIYRILKNDGSCIVTIPFLFPVHADPYDFQRWTSTKIINIFENCGFECVNISPMGGTVAVIVDILHIRMVDLTKKNIFFRKISMGIISAMKIFLRKHLKRSNEKITTGYSLIAKKRNLKTSPII